MPEKLVLREINPGTVLHGGWRARLTFHCGRPRSDREGLCSGPQSEGGLSWGGLPGLDSSTQL